MGVPSFRELETTFDLLAGLGFTSPRVGGITPFSTVRIAFMSAESPDAASLCPMLVLTYGDINYARLSRARNLPRLSTKGRLQEVYFRSTRSQRHGPPMDHQQLSQSHDTQSSL